MQKKKRWKKQKKNETKLKEEKNEWAESNSQCKEAASRELKATRTTARQWYSRWPTSSWNDFRRMKKTKKKKRRIESLCGRYRASHRAEQTSFQFQIPTRTLPTVYKTNVFIGIMNVLIARAICACFSLSRFAFHGGSTSADSEMLNRLINQNDCDLRRQPALQLSYTGGRVSTNARSEPSHTKNRLESHNDEEWQLWP